MLTQATDLLRERYAISHRNENDIIIDNQRLINFSSNDYLGLASHPALKKAFIAGVERYGVGSGASALVSGFYQSHQQCEEAFAAFFQREKAILFNSGYLANLSIIQTLITRNKKIVADKLCHASILDGIQLSRGQCVRYRHQDIIHLQSILQQTAPHLLITESVFSMEGDISPITDIANLAKLYQVPLMVDDAHSAGVLGENGRGISEYYHLTSTALPYLVVPLGKAFASMGAIVCGSRELIDSLIQFARSYCYTTALPPAIAHATMTALQLVEKENWRRHRLNELIQFFIQQAQQRNLNLVSTDLTPIKSILIGENASTVKIKNKLLEQGFFVACIRPPTVPVNTARLRISLNCLHHENDIIQLLDLIADAHEEC
jgi:8-amino-7-oxononanoate synthase